MENLKNIEGKIVKLNKAAKAEVEQVWLDWKTAPFNPYIEGRNTREQYNETNRRGQALVDVQTKHGVWLIHPENAKAGLKTNDKRILD